MKFGVENVIALGMKGEQIIIWSLKAPFVNNLPFINPPSISPSRSFMNLVIGPVKSLVCGLIVRLAPESNITGK